MRASVSELKIEEKKEETESKPKEEELKAVMSELEQKSKEDAKDCKRFLDAACEVEEVEGESLHKRLFSMLIRDCVDTILKKEVMYLSMEMTSFRSNLALQISSDERDDPLNVAALYESFQKAWQVWRAGDTESGRDGRAKASYEVFTSLLFCKQED